MIIIILEHLKYKSEEKKGTYSSHLYLEANRKHICPLNMELVHVSYLNHTDYESWKLNSERRSFHLNSKMRDISEADISQNLRTYRTYLSGSCCKKQKKGGILTKMTVLVFNKTKYVSKFNVVLVTNGPMNTATILFEAILISSTHAHNDIFTVLMMLSCRFLKWRYIILTIS